MFGARLSVIGIALAIGFQLNAQASDLVIAHVGPFSGPLGINGQANHDGSKACVGEANAAGGVNGRQVRLVKEDDQYKPEETIRLLKEVAARDKPSAFVNLLGSPNITQVLKDDVLEGLKVPAVGATPGSDSLRSPGSPWLFHVHASDNAQLARILRHVSTVGIKKIAVAYQDIPFGTGGLKYIEQQAAGFGVEVVGRVPVASNSTTVDAAVADIRKSGAQTYVLVLNPVSAPVFIAKARETGDRTPLYAMSYVSVKGVLDKAGTAGAVGVGLAQVTPNTYSSSNELVRRFHLAMEKHAAAAGQPSQLNLIGYLNCRVALEGIRNAGTNPTPEQVRAALTRLRADLGGYFIEFGGKNEGSKFVEIGVVTQAGKLQY